MSIFEWQTLLTGVYLVRCLSCTMCTCSKVPHAFVCRSQGNWYSLAMAGSVVCTHSTCGGEMRYHPCLSAWSMSRCSCWSRRCRWATAPSSHTTSKNGSCVTNQCHERMSQHYVTKSNLISRQAAPRLQTNVTKMSEKKVVLKTVFTPLWQHGQLMW